MRAFSFVAKFVVTVAVGSAALAAALAMLVPAGTSITKATTPIGRVDLEISAPASRSIVYDRFEGVMGAFSVEDRSPITLRDVPQVLIDAVLSIEDRKFYEHNGVDWVGTARALFRNVDAGETVQGGSTITQQLVKNTITTDRKRDLKTKASEAILAIQLEEELSKDEILERYLNLVYFGNRAYGVQAAAERYFLTPENPEPLKKLTLGQAALLAGLIQRPEALNPIKHPDLAARRRGQVLDAMVANGKITEEEAKKANAEPLPTKLSYPVSRSLDYYLDEVKNRLLLDDPDVEGDPAEVLGPDEKSRAKVVYREGLKIYTEYDPFLQLAAQDAMNRVLPKSEYTASMVVIDNSDGGVRAMANGRSFSEMQFNPATEAQRQTGSAFKVFTLAAALSRGYSPDDSINANNLRWQLRDGRREDDFYDLSGRKDDCHGGSPTLTQAVAKSDNCAFVRLELSMGPGNYGQDGVKQVISTAVSMGLDSAKRYEPHVSTTLGTQGANPLEMAQAYSTLPNDGVLKRANFISKIVDANGKVIYQNNEAGHRVLDENVARAEVQMLESVIRSGTASSSLGRFPRPAAGKTGTTTNHVDAWFVGFVPQFTAAVWMGHPKEEKPMTNLPVGSVFGASYPAQIWREFMLSATKDLPVVDFTPPNEDLFPRASYITEMGRRFSFRRGSGSSTPTTVAPPPETPTTVVTPTTTKSTPPSSKPSPQTTTPPPQTTVPPDP